MLETYCINVPNLRFPEFSGEWELVALKEVADFANGKAHEDSVSEDGKYILINSKFISTEGKVKKYTDKQLSPLYKNQIVMVMSDLPNGKALAKCYYINEDDKYTLNQRICSLTPTCCDSRFLLYQINRNKYYLRFDDGVYQTNLKKGEVLNCPVYLPSSNEQQKISALLSLLDQRIATQKKVIEDLKKLKDAISKSLFSRYDLLEAKMQISQIGSLKNGYAFQSSSYDSSGEYEIITIANVAGERHICTEDCNRIHTLPSDLQPHQEIKDGDILISLTGNVGRVSLCKEGKYLLNQRVGLLQLKTGVNREFVYQVLSSHKFELSMISCGQGAAQMNIGKGDVESYEIPYSNNPQNLHSVSLILKSYDKLVLTESMRLQLLLNQKQYIISNMFI